MYGYDDFGAGCDERFNFICIDIGVIGHAVGKHNLRSLTDKSQCGGNKGVARNYHFVARLNVAQYGCHLQRIGTRSGKQAFLKTIPVFKKLLASLSKHAVARYFSGTHCFLYVFCFVTGEVGFVEWDHWFNSLVIIIFPGKPTK